MDPLRAVAKNDGRFRLQAYQFLFESLDTAVQITGKDEVSSDEKHVTGKQLLDGMRVHATRMFGPLAAQVWRSWGVNNTYDWGQIVFNLVEHKMLRRQESDTIEDFRGGYDFDEAFVHSYAPTLPTELEAVPRPPVGPGGPQAT